MVLLCQLAWEASSRYHPALQLHLLESEGKELRGMVQLIRSYRRRIGMCPPPAPNEQALSAQLGPSTACRYAGGFPGGHTRSVLGHDDILGTHSSVRPFPRSGKKTEKPARRTTQPYLSPRHFFGAACRAC